MALCRQEDISAVLIETETQFDPLPHSISEEAVSPLPFVVYSEEAKVMISTQLNAALLSEATV